MKRKRILWQIYLPVVLIIISSVFISTWYSANSLRKFSIEQTKNDLSTRAKLISKQIAGPFFAQDFETLNQLSKQIGQESATRITVINNSGVVVTDSQEDTKSMENHADRIEIKQALKGEIGSAIRYSNTLHQKMLYIAIPLTSPLAKTITVSSDSSILRLSIPITSIDHALQQVFIKIGFGALVLVIIAAALVLTVSRKITKPLEEIKIYAEQLSREEFRGNFTLIPEKDISEEIAGLAVAMNTMATQLNDRFEMLTKQRNMRRDFVANVSHELRTPITAIKGFVETLQDGAISCPDDATRFLKIILKHADRLNAIVGDLLTLSRIEQEDEQKEIILQTGFVRDILNNAVETCSSKAQEKNISLSIHCHNELTANMDEALLEQAVVNLVINAIKYSNEKSIVHINGQKEMDEVVISVKDFGAGITKEHLPRLFERFYRSDKARSRKLGGTGLGLSIVKHIAKSHGGTVDVKSIPCLGSTFSIKIPG